MNTKTENPRHDGRDHQPEERKLLEDGLPEEFSAEDLESLDENERDAILGEQNAEREAREAEESAAREAEEKAREPEPEPEPKPEPKQPEIEAPDTEAAQAALDDAKRKRDELHTKYEDGEIGAAEWREQLGDLDDAVADARADLKAAEKITQSTEKARKEVEDAQAQEWYGKVDTYMDQNPELKDPANFQNWDAALRAVTSRAKEGDSFDDLIRSAHQSLAVSLEAMGTPLKNPPKAGQKSEAKADPKPERDPLPPTLARVPASDSAGIGEGRFSQVDRAIDSDVYEGEAAVASMSERDRERWLAGE